MPSRKQRGPHLAQPVTDTSIDVWADLMKDAPEERRPDDLDVNQIAAWRKIEIAQAGKWAEKQVKMGLLEKHKIKDPGGKPKTAYHPVHNSADPLMTKGLSERDNHKRAG